MDPQTYGQLIFDKAVKNIQWNKDSLFNKWCWENRTAPWRRMNLDHFLTPSTKINSKWIKPKHKTEGHQNPRGESRQNLFDLGCSNLLLNKSLEARDTKAKMNYCDVINIKSFWGTWVAQLVKSLTLAQVMISRLVGLNPALGSVLTAQSLEPTSNSVSPSLSLTLPHLYSVSLSKINKH